MSQYKPNKTQSRILMITSVLLNWKRPENVERIVRYLDKHSLIDEILVWDESPDQRFQNLSKCPKVRVIVPEKKYGLVSRWKASLLAKNDAIFMQDDDLILSHQDISNYHDKWTNESDIIHGLVGRYADHKEQYTCGIYGINSETEIVLTRAMMFHKKYAGMFFESEKNHHDTYIKNIIRRNGEDIYFNFLIMSKSGLCNRTHKLIKPVIELPSLYAISDRNPDHFKERTVIMNACRKIFNVEKRHPFFNDCSVFADLLSS